MRFLKIKSHLVVKLFIIVLSFCAVSILSSPIHAYQNSVGNQSLSIIENESSAELLTEMLVLGIYVAQVDISQERKAEILAEVLEYDCSDICALATFFDEIDDLFPPLAIITEILWLLRDFCLLIIE